MCLKIWLDVLKTTLWMFSILFCFSLLKSSQNDLSTIGSSGRGNSAELQVDGGEQGMEATAATIAEVVEIKSPENKV